MKISHSLVALLIGTLLPVSAFAAYKGSKSNFTLNFTAISEVGGFLVRDSAIEPALFKGIEYSDPANPLGFSYETELANYYLVRRTEKESNFGTSAEPDFYVVNDTYEKVARQIAEKFTNKNFIDELIARDFVPITSPVGYRLVMVQPSSAPDSDAEHPMLFFIENKTNIYYVGRQGDYETALPEDALMIDFGGGVESYKYVSRTVFKHTKVKVEGETYVELDDIGVNTETDTYTGKSVTYIDIFPGYYDEGSDSTLNTGTEFWYSGVANYAGRLDKTLGDYLTIRATLSATASRGSFFDASYGDSQGALVTGAFALSGTKYVADIAPYLDALPASLAELKAAIIAGYGEMD